jgi:peptide/nickel transport system ATP-binding protein
LKVVNLSQLKRIYADFIVLADVACIFVLMATLTSHSPLLTLKNLSIAFYRDGAYDAVTHDVSFSLFPGEFLGIVGESGSGKSVSSLAIMGLLPKRFARIAGGEIWYESTAGKKELSALDEAAYRNIRGKEIAMIFQEPMSALNPVMTCGEQLDEMLQIHAASLSAATRKKQVLDLFEEVKLPRPEKIYYAYPHELSGGQRQRIMIAMALSCNPRLLIADEPTTALDVAVQATILDLLKELQQKRQMAVLLITHDLGVVAEVADRVIVMQNGKIVESATTEKLFSKAEHPYTRGLIHCKPSNRERLARLFTVNDFVNNAHPTKKLVDPADRAQKHCELYSKSPILEVEGLKTWYSSRTFFWQKPQYVKAVDDVSFQLYEQETLGLVGESGSGKSTIGRSILRLTEPTAGRILYKGKDVLSLKGDALREYRKQVQIIFQDPFASLNPRLTVGQAIAEPLAVYGLRNSNKSRMERVQELLSQVGIDPAVYQRYPHEFSGGQRQRMVIARCLALEPATIICDESVSALDVSVQAQVLNLLKQLQDQLKLSFIFISHDLSVIKHMSDRVLVLQHGKAMELQEADTLYNKPLTEYTRQLIAALPDQRFESLIRQ